MDTLYRQVVEVYQRGYSALLAGPCDKMALALFVIWRDRGYPAQFRIGNKELAESINVASSNTKRIRERLIREFVVNDEPVITYKSRGQAKTGSYLVNAILLLPDEDISDLIKTSIKHQQNIERNIEVNPVKDSQENPAQKPLKDLEKHYENIMEREKKNIPSTTTTKSSSRWDVIPFAHLPELSQEIGISQSNREKLDVFGIQYLRAIDERFYTPSSTDTEMLYELFRGKTPKQIVELVKQAKEEGIDDALLWITGGSDV